MGRSFFDRHLYSEETERNHSHGFHYSISQVCSFFCLGNAFALRVSAFQIYNVCCFFKQAMVSSKRQFVRGGMPHAHLKTPTKWPSDTKVDPGKWVYWLPEGWMQGIRTHITSGKDLKCYLL